MAKNRDEMSIEVPGLRETLRALNKLPKEVQAAVRVAAREIAEDEAERLAAAGKRSDRQSRLVAEQIRTKSDRVPAILAGGSKKLAPSRKIHRSRTQKLKSGRGKLVKPAAGDVFFGAEFGGRRRSTTQQFQPWRGRQGRWFWPQLRADQDRMVEAYAEALDDVIKEAETDG